MVPLSTACWDPKWYHNFKGPSTVYIDSYGVINGLRINPLHPDETCNYQCAACNKTGDPNTCDFLKKYKEQLYNIDFNGFMEHLCSYMDVVQKQYLCTTEELFAIFIVHEAPGNECSERRVIQGWFNDNGVICREWAGELL